MGRERGGGGGGLALSLLLILSVDGSFQQFYFLDELEIIHTSSSGTTQSNYIEQPWRRTRKRNKSDDKMGKAANDYHPYDWKSSNREEMPSSLIHYMEERKKDKASHVLSPSLNESNALTVDRVKAHGIDKGRETVHSGGSEDSSADVKIAGPRDTDAMYIDNMDKYDAMCCFNFMLWLDSCLLCLCNCQ